MKRQLAIILCLLLLAAGFPVNAFAAGTASSYSTVVPLKYGQIQEINGDLFVAVDSGNAAEVTVGLYRFDGTKLLSGKKGITFEDGWVRVTTGDGLGVYSWEGVEVIAPQYEEMTISKDGVRCLVVEGEEFIRPGYWCGQLYLYDLTTGSITENRGYGAVDYGILDSEPAFDPGADPSNHVFENGIRWTTTTGGIAIYTSEGALVSSAYQKISTVCGDIIYVKNSAGLIGGIDWQGNVIVPFLYNWTFLQQQIDYPVMILVQNCDMENVFTSGTTDIYNKSGQKLATPFGNEYICDGNLIRGYDWDKGMNYIYTGRGREIAQPIWNASYSGIGDGRYLIAGSENPYVINLDGETVIQPGVFDSYQLDYVSCYSSLAVSDQKELIIVGKYGKYGVIKMKEYTPKPSAGLAEQIAEAVSMGLVAEDIRPYWKDNCTREEFCRMLIPAIEKAAGEKITELTEEKSPVSFTDCDDEAVLAAAALGIVSGVGHQRFAPGFFVTEKQASVMIEKAQEILGAATAEAATGEGTYDAERFLTVEETAVRMLDLVEENAR